MEDFGQDTALLSLSSSLIQSNCHLSLYIFFGISTLKKNWRVRKRAYCIGKRATKMANTRCSFLGSVRTISVNTFLQDGSDHNQVMMGPGEVGKREMRKRYRKYMEWEGGTETDWPQDNRPST